jgi:predicted dehydrogenase
VAEDASHISVDLYSDDAESGKGYDDLLKRDDIKGVIIALPILNQPDYIKKALTAGKHVLAEKPIAKDVATGEELLKFSKNLNNGATFGIAENFRFLDSFVYAADQVKTLGRILMFRVKMHTMVNLGGKYIETAWRKVPEYQGGFLLDGGVHFVAGIRLILGSDNAPIKVAAFTTQLQKHLPPVDSVDATWRLKSGGSGTFSVSFGTTFGGGGCYEVACENGTVTVIRDTVTVTKDGKEDTKEFSNGSGVKPEVKAWAEGLQSGKPNPRQAPDEGLRDIAVVSCALSMP